MGNVVLSSVGMMGKINGWFIHTAVHPISFGIGSIIKKPIVYNDDIAIREILNMTVLIDHNVIDGAPMTKFIHELTRNIEKGIGL
jgi:pyruvate/2-oxoglutarate dehydrogenase complex dihydrolipoamide acyltransferase (E2) component